MAFVKRSYNRQRYSKPVNRKKYFSRRKQSSVVKVVKNVVEKKLAEHKFRNVEMSVATLHGGDVLAFNPLYWIPQDDTFTGRNGSKIQNVSLHVRALLTFNGVQNVPLGPTNYPWAGGKVRVVVFKHHSQWRNSSETTLSDITIGGSGTNISETSMFLKIGRAHV